MSQHNPIAKPTPLCLAALTTLLLLLAPTHTHAKPDDSPQPIMTLDQVRIGMRGYGLSVFHGIRIEPFEVEVISIMRNFAPGRSVIWIRCGGERMQKLGPVQGMSGSPIYLWTDEDPADPQLGKGGLLIGAFALGFSGSKDCYVGVQPIEQMRDAGSRAVVNNPHAQARAQQGSGRETLALAKRVIDELGLPPQRTYRARAILDLASPARSTPTHSTHARHAPAPPVPAIFSAGQLMPLMLPIAIDSPQIARLLLPAFAPLGLMPISSPGTSSSTDHTHATPHAGAAVGLPPPGIDPNAIKLEPGSVLSVPLAFGDLDMSATGTVTEVLPDGRVLAFGHGMFSQGALAVPMATGYIHMVIPSIASSFKLGGSAVIQGTLVRDENTAVVGIPDTLYTTAPAKITVHFAGQDPITYHYQIVHHKRLTPFIASAVVLQSVLAKTAPPIESTVRLSGTLDFDGGRRLTLDTLLANPSPRELMAQVLPIATVMANNPHQSMALQSLDLTVEIEPVLRAATLLNARIDRPQYTPGDTIGITIDIQTYNKPVTQHHLKLPIPSGLTDGDYELIICDTPTYAQLMLDGRPHLKNPSSADDLAKTVQMLLDIPDDAVFAVLQSPEPGLAVSHQELPYLPSSKRAIFDTPTNTTATPYTQWVQKTFPMGLVVEGKARFTIPIHKTTPP